jgi:hypothetical protein
MGADKRFIGRLSIMEADHKIPATIFKSMSCIGTATIGISCREFYVHPGGKEQLYACTVRVCFTLLAL